jgi:hypothetical protein
MGQQRLSGGSGAAHSAPDEEKDDDEDAPDDGDAPDDEDDEASLPIARARLEASHDRACSIVVRERAE